MPINSSSAPLRDLVNQYGANSPQVTRIVTAVNSSPYLETLWNDFAARTTAGGGSPVIRVAFVSRAKLSGSVAQHYVEGPHQLMPDAHGQAKTLPWPAVGRVH